MYKSDAVSYSLFTCEFIMGRLSNKKKRAKRKHQKKIKKLKQTVHCSFSSAPTYTASEILSSPSKITLGTHELNGSNNTPSDHENTYIGDQDTDIIEMNLYDVYRGEYGQPNSSHYLKKCIEKLTRKVRYQREKICVLEKENTDMKVEHKRETERIRQFYDTIAFGRSRSGLIVRTAMGRTSTAARIIKELKALYSVDQDQNYQ